MKKLMLLALIMGLASSAWAWIPGEGASDFEGQTSSDVATALVSQNPLLVPAPELSGAGLFSRGPLNLLTGLWYAT